MRTANFNFNFKLIGLAAVLLAQVSCATAQSNQNVVKKVFSLSSGTQNSANLPNSGFGQHFLQATVSEAGGTCNAQTVATLQASTDGTNYFTAATPIYLNYAGNILTKGVYANGVFPFLRVQMVSAQAFCKYTVYYIGSVNPISNPQSTLNTSNYATTTITAPASVGGTVSTLATNPTSDSRYVVYGSVATNLDSADHATFQIIGCLAGPTYSGGGPTLRALANGDSSILPASITPYLVSAVGYNLCVLGLAAADSSAAITVTYRLE